MSREKPASEHTAAEVVQAFKANDESVLSKVYARHYESVAQYILQNNGTDDDARDIYQEAMLVLWQNAVNGKFDTSASPNIGGYLYQTAKHKWLDRLKSAQNRHNVRRASVEVADIVDEETAEHELKLKHLTALLEELGDTCKSILTLFYHGRKSLEEIGKALNYDAATMRTKKYRCMMQLRKMYEDTKHQNLQ